MERPRCFAACGTDPQFHSSCSSRSGAPWRMCRATSQRKRIRCLRPARWLWPSMRCGCLRAIAVVCSSSVHRACRVLIPEILIKELKRNAAGDSQRWSWCVTDEGGTEAKLGNDTASKAFCSRPSGDLVAGVSCGSRQTRLRTGFRYGEVVRAHHCWSFESALSARRSTRAPSPAATCG